MQVKKFEARSMKEALEMIKTQLGPDAIILSAKEITKGFGLGGEKSIEVTAAYSEAILHKKKFAESKMATPVKEKFQRISAKDQKEVMRKMVESQIAKINSQNGPKAATPAIPYKMTEKRYVEIDEDTADHPSAGMTSSSRTSTPGYGGTSIRAANGGYGLQTARYNQGTDFGQDSYNQGIGHGSQATAGAANNMNVTEVAKKVWNDMEVTSLKQEIETLKQVMTQFKSVPQSFVQAHPGADHGVHYHMSSHFQKLTQAGLMPELAGEIIAYCQKHLSTAQQHNKGVVDSLVAKYMLDTVKIADIGQEQFHLFVGPSGSGKTSALIKIASDMILNQKKRIAIISTDNSKVGAAEQMKIFSQILNVPFLTVRSQQDWSHVIPHLDQLDHVLVDFSGLNLRNQEEVTYMKRMSPPVYRSMRTHLVLSSLAKDIDLIECAKRYEAFGFQDVFFAGLDEASQHGNIYNFIRKSKAELFAFGIGPKVPEDFEYATAERIVDLILRISHNKRQEATA